MKNPQIKVVFDRKKQATTSLAKKPKKGLLQIELLYDRKRRFLSTGIKLFANQWSERSQSIVNSAEQTSLNSLLQQIKSSILDQIREQTKRGRYDISEIKLITSETTTFESCATEYVKRCSERGDKETTIARYNSIINLIAEFGGFDEIGGLNARQLDAFDAFMLKRGYTSKTRNVRLTFVKCVAKFAADEGIVQSNQVASYKPPRPKTTERHYLLENQIEAILNLELKKNRERCRDVFIFQCYTGLSISDILTLQRDMFRKEGDNWFLVRQRVKTAVRYRLMLLPPAMGVVKKYNFELPKIDKTTYAYNLKIIGELVGLPFRLTSHIGRHTFATWALSHEVPIEIVSKMLGHSDIRTTQIYAKVLARDVDAQFVRLAQSFK